MEPSTYTGGPAQLVLTASIARRYYVDGRSKVEIADEFNLSRFKVARLLEAARSSGMVRIEIGYPGAADRLGRAEMLEQRPLARRADARNLVERGGGDRLLALGAVRANSETMRLVPELLNAV